MAVATASPTTPPVAPPGRDGLARLIRAEWTKLRSVPRWTLTMLAAVLLTTLVSVLGASSSGFVGYRPVTGPDGTQVADDFHFVHQPLAGDGSITARVVAQRSGNDEAEHEWAKAGVMIKESTRQGSPYAAVMVTPGHGVRFQANFTTDRAGTATRAPRWLRLTRAGASITGYESADGATWRQLGTVTIGSLPRTVEVGLFVASPQAYRFERQFGSSSAGLFPTASTATFDGVGVDAAQPREPAPWSDEDVGEPTSPGGSGEAGGTFTVTGAGDVAPRPPGDDVTRLSLTGIFVGLMAIIALSVLSITSEYKRGMIRTTFTASPRRGRVLAAKAIVLAGCTFVVGLVASVAAFLAAQPILRSNGFAPPAFPRASLTDPAVLRAVVGTAALVALVAVICLALGAILRRSAGAVAIMIVLLVIPQFVVSALPVTAGQWVMRATPVAGFAIQETVRRYDHVASLCLPETGCFVDGPLVGFAVLCAYAAASLALAAWLLRRRDA